MGNAKRARGGFGGSARSAAPKSDYNMNGGTNPMGSDQATSTQPYGPITSGVGQGALREAVCANEPTVNALKTNRWGS